MAGVRFLVVDYYTTLPLENVYCHDSLGGGYTDVLGYTGYFDRAAGGDTWWTLELSGYDTVNDYWVQPATYPLTFSVHMTPSAPPVPTKALVVHVTRKVDGTPTCMVSPTSGTHHFEEGVTVPVTIYGVSGATYDYAVVRNNDDPLDPATNYNTTENNFSLVMTNNYTLTVNGTEIVEPSDGEVFNPALLLLPVGFVFAAFIAYKLL